MIPAALSSMLQQGGATSADDLLVLHAGVGGSSRRAAEGARTRALLDIWAMAKPQTRTQPELGDAFPFMADIITGGRPAATPPRDHGLFGPPRWYGKESQFPARGARPDRHTAPWSDPVCAHGAPPACNMRPARAGGISGCV